MDAITKESKEWIAALKWVPEIYEPNKRCPIDRVFCPHFANRDNRCTPHDIPIPDITPDLLYAILIAGLKRCPYFLNRVDIQVHVLELPLADGIIRAAASLQEAK